MYRGRGLGCPRVQNSSGVGGRGSKPSPWKDLWCKAARGIINETAGHGDHRACDLGVKVHFLLSGAPEHVSFLLVEADRPSKVAMLTSSIPLPRTSTSRRSCMSRS